MIASVSGVDLNSNSPQTLRAQTDLGTEFTLQENEMTLASYARGDTEVALFMQERGRLGIRHRRIWVRTSELNDKGERSHRNYGERFYSCFKVAEEHALHHVLQNVWMPEYDNERPHSSRVPDADEFYQKASAGDRRRKTQRLLA